MRLLDGGQGNSSVLGPPCRDVKIAHGWYPIRTMVEPFPVTTFCFPVRGYSSPDLLDQLPLDRHLC